MNNVLFIGNGLNRTLDGDSWGKLMNRIAEEYSIEFNEDNSFPLEFEKMINEILKKNPSKGIQIYNDVKQYIINMIQNIKTNEYSIHNRLKEIKCNDIITTNYDFILEKVYIDEGTDFTKYKPSEEKYIMNKLPINMKNLKFNFYHIHGVASKPSTICLGYEHYAGFVEKLRGSINKKEQLDKTKMIIKQKLLNEKKWDNHWYEFFYNSNIYILGFNLDLSEIDIWWILTHRAFLYYSNYEGLKEKIKNEIYFYDTYEVSKNNRTKLHSLLKGLNVNVIDHPVNNKEEYLLEYNKIIDEIKEKINKHPNDN